MEVHLHRTTCLITTKQILATTLAQKFAFLEEKPNIQKEFVAVLKLQFCLCFAHQLEAKCCLQMWRLSRRIYGQLKLKVALKTAAIIDAEAGGLMPLPLQIGLNSPSFHIAD